MSTELPDQPRTACRVTIRGIVQGVGLRPFVFRAAQHHQVAGWVQNDAAGVEVHAEATPRAIQAFVDELRADCPPAARIAEFAMRSVAAEGIADFQIRASRREGPPTVRVTPDLCICPDCLAELFDPADRHFHYPYINCTNCGPRYSIVQRLPYDRANTTMVGWPMCSSCRAEYDNRLDRRYHAQPVACPACGPAYRLLEGEVTVDDSSRAIERAAAMIKAGRIVAIKGIGGYHLACDARRPAAVESLRSRKYRKEKPFAVMVRNLDEARELAELSAEHERLLEDVARPIVLAPRRVELPGVAPDNVLLGIMLPYTPLHHLLFAAGAPSPLVLTSANRSSEPIAFRDADALEALSGIADAFLMGERPIARRVDDSVVAVRGSRTQMIRRSRGYTPTVVGHLAIDEPLLAVGADLKNTIALVVHGDVLVSQHIGDLGDLETDRSFADTVGDLLAMYEIDPRDLVIAHDRHPEFVSTRFALSLPARMHVAVQHHHAHVASVMAEHELLEEPVVGVAFDGTGYGNDGAIWGGEFFVGSVRSGFTREDSLRPVQMPGGDAAARFPVQAAAGFLAELDDLPDMTAEPFGFPARFHQARQLVERRVRCFTSTSAGRLFDAVAALVGFTRESTFEGQAAMWLEFQARASAPRSPYPCDGLDARPLLRAIIRDRLAGRPIGEIAAAFHATLAATVVEQMALLAGRHGLRFAALSGGVFQNELLVESIDREVSARGLPIKLLFNSSVPANDGGIALGQAALASMVLSLGGELLR